MGRKSKKSDQSRPQSFSKRPLQIKNPDQLKRLNYLYQASFLLNSISTPSAMIQSVPATTNSSNSPKKDSSISNESDNSPETEILNKLPTTTPSPRRPGRIVHLANGKSMIVFLDDQMPNVIELPQSVSPRIGNNLSEGVSTGLMDVSRQVWNHIELDGRVKMSISETNDSTGLFELIQNEDEHGGDRKSKEKEIEKEKEIQTGRKPMKKKKSKSGLKIGHGVKKLPLLSGLSRFYISELRNIGKRGVLKLDPTVKRSFCKRCNQIWIPGVTVDTEVTDDTFKSVFPSPFFKFNYP
ncbi:hypothetical protein BKA69DRAFT_1122513 [Paraphysoderma sedebokerense]|nr:hypothetical protein BKA69DRAFT_1122513 [Paraphysoderma sedebokerense]